MRLAAQVSQEMEQAKDRALDSGEAHIQRVTETVTRIAIAVMDGDGTAAREYMEKVKEQVTKAGEALNEELSKALDKAEKRGDAKARQLAAMVRALYSRKSEKVKLDETERETLVESVLTSVNQEREPRPGDEGLGADTAHLHRGGHDKERQTGRGRKDSRAQGAGPADVGAAEAMVCERDNGSAAGHTDI